MSKKKVERRLAETEAMAVLRNLRTSPRKLNLVAESIRGLGAAVALSQLAVNKRRVAQHVRKALQSAIARIAGESIITEVLADGARVTPGTVVSRWEGPAHWVLALERPALNLAGFASGIATRTAGLVELVRAAGLAHAPRVTSTRAGRRMRLNACAARTLAPERSIQLPA